MSLRTLSTDKKIRKKLKKTKIKSQETVSKNKNYCLIIVNTSDKNIHVHYQVENDEDNSIYCPEQRCDPDKIALIFGQTIERSTDM